jgi:hypothetical protein
MTVLINVVLLALGFVGTLAAFGGETWKKGDEPLLNRVTRRGWLSLFCLFLALTLGITKEVRNSGEKAGLEDQVAQLHDQLKQQRVLLVAKRLEEIRDQDRAIEDVERRISLIQDAYERFRASTVKVEGRAQARNTPPSPYKLRFSYLSNDFRLDVCNESFRTEAKLKFAPDACRSAEVPAVVRLLPTQAYERSPFGPSVIAMIQFLSEISIAHRDALNGVHTVEERDAPEMSLADLFGEGHKWCGVPPDIAAAEADRARVLRTIEGAAQQLYWLFTYGYAAHHHDAKEAKWLGEQFLGASSELLVQMSRLNEMVRTSTSSTDKEQALMLGVLIENVATGYQQLTRDIAQAKSGCQAKREQLQAERQNIETGNPLVAASNE